MSGKKHIKSAFVLHIDHFFYLRKCFLQFTLNKAAFGLLEFKKGNLALFPSESMSVFQDHLDIECRD